ncbi:programmed cell death protein 2-like [Echeneis naucrates]|uniref:Programmed cell death protein 2 C-terminal domain-containing protein n=1 Tax=Echeneis naucrates TaxID=173247 RepID=A0A665W0B0_ECHNA|nr:programmed cell death protein 2-like [Echeneis naucrates]
MASAPQEVNLIGVCDGELDPKKYRSSFLTNKVGGRPDWPPAVSPQAPRCGLCGAPSAHVVQVYCPLDASPYHRSLHLFACPAAECSGRSEGWRLLRSQCLESGAAAAGTPGRPAPPPEAPLSATDWCDAADDWGMEGQEGWGGGDTRAQQAEPQAEGSGLSSGLQSLSLGAAEDDGPVFRPFFISVVEESDLCGQQDLDHVQDLLRDYESREGAVAAVGQPDGGEEKYEKTGARHGDAVFSRFMKKVSLCPQQVLRYCHRGKPRFICRPPASMERLVPACGSCGGSRTFELQLMPALVSLLRRKDGGAEAELEFGTVLAYTCEKSCWTAGSGSALEEFCFVQADPDQQFFK